MNVLIDDKQFTFYIDTLKFELRLRAFSLDDYSYFIGIRKAPFNGDEIVKRILYNQIVPPDLTYEEFEEISDSKLINLGLEFINKNF